MKLENDPNLKNSFIRRIINRLLEEHEKDSNNKYFGCSALHRKKQRILQTLLVLQPMFNEEQSKIVFSSLLGSLSGESPQPSVRYLTEWILVMTLTKYPELWEQFFSESVKFWRKRMGYGVHFCSICLHAFSLLPLSNTEIFKKGLDFLCQLVVSHHATVRAYASVCFEKIYNKLKLSNSMPEVLGKFDVMFSSLQSARSFCTGTSAKILDAIEKDFFIQIFEPHNHHTKEVIFIYLPRLSGMASDETPTEWCLNKVKISVNIPTTASTKLDVNTLKELYSRHEDTAWHLKNAPVGDRELGEELPVTLNGTSSHSENQSGQTPRGNFQRKINPWKTLPISETLMDDLKDSVVEKKRSAIEDGLILVASLIDKIPNLGGLCRSCEVFGVSKYVISTLKTIEDQQFQNLSVSSENWVDIMEVPPHDLATFLSSYKAKGYCILGIEQAQESTPLNKFQFPRKSLLLLGHEKYGIPNDLLELVDHCLELPQVGVTRSLNVHVTGALTIWEYALQHQLSSD